MGEISIGVNPKALKLWGNSSSCGQRPEYPRVLLLSPSFSWACSIGAVAAGLIIAVVLWSACFVFDRGNLSREAALGMGYKLQEE